MNNLTQSLNFKRPELGKAISKVFEKIEPLIEKGKRFPLDNEEYYTLVSGVWIVQHLSGKTNSKLDGGCSVSTDCHSCEFCRKRWELAQKEIEQKGSTDIICASCYAEVQQRIYAGLVNRNWMNGEILKNVLIPQEAWDAWLSIPYSAFFRVESFGDTDSVTQARNYIRIARAIIKRYGIPVAVWSKNPKVWAKAFELEGKPEGMLYVHSSLRINKRDAIPECIRPYVDHRFTVFSKEYLARHPEIRINCGGRSCRGCMRCYMLGTEFDIFEELK